MFRPRLLRSRDPTALVPALLSILLMLGIVACSDDDDDGMSPDPEGDISADFAVSLHATGRGMGYWYEAEQGGFEVQTGIPYEDLSCAGCHTPARCDNCHSTIPGDNSVPQAVCLGCHGRQQAEILKKLPDVHRDAGMLCIDCHTTLEMHGNGVAHNSMFEEGARETTCETCHEEVASNAAHEQHGTDVNCASCHMETAVTCLNCHFRTEVEEGRKQAFTKDSGWVFLGNFNDQVYPMNFQSVEFDDESFVAYGPFVGHTITREARDCADCHGNPAAQTYLDEGSIQVVEWDEAGNTLVPAKGLIPVPPDFETALLHDFATFSDGAWSFLEAGPDRAQMLFGAPLSRAQIEALAAARGGGR